MGEPRKDFSSLGAWVKDGLHLPSPLRDFHDQKDAIRLAMAECVSLEQEVLSDG